MKSKFNYLLLGTILLTSCEDFFVKEIPPPEYNEVYSVYSISNDLKLGPVKVYKSHPLFGVKDNYIDVNDLLVENATVYIKSLDSKHLIPYSFNFITREYNHNPTSDSFKLEPGMKYVLNVEIPNAETLSSEIETIDPSIGFPETISEEIRYVENQFRNEVNSFISGTLEGLKPNSYYYLEVYITVPNTGSDLKLAIANDGFFSTTNETKKDFGGNYVYYDIASFEGVTNVSYKLYQLNKSLYQYALALDEADFDGDPFAEPVILENNIANGVGIFGCSVLKEYD